ncbi:hypothetical protein BCY88_09590 [Paraburkholderia fungorum]|uniref:Uncharacterized protein n=1 Tax=Paraburkholderia fungorum TaxID=134537 RepID=A0A3R7GNZ0_9BURK|nr:hypothetical protein BCY88_09590 [Paraburkholderia fungorum]
MLIELFLLACCDKRVGIIMQVSERAKYPLNGGAPRTQRGERSGGRALPEQTRSLERGIESFETEL